MVKYLMFCVFVAAGYIMYTSFPVKHGPGVTVQNAPQVSSITWQQPFTFKEAKLHPKKTIEAEVRILEKKRYFIDTFSRFSPADAVVGWNEMSDERNLDYIYHTLSNRSVDVGHPKSSLTEKKMFSQSDLWHLIPSTSAIHERIRQLRKGHIISIKGLVVDISHNDSGFQFQSPATVSSSHIKQGNAIWIESFEIY